MAEGEKKMQSRKDKAMIATLAGGCFWCIAAAFDGEPGIISVVSGYTGGQKEDPSYEEVCTGMTGHREAVQLTYYPEKISYARILEIYWRQIDPTDDGGQFVDRGSQYRTAIFYHDASQKKEAEESKKRLEKSGRFDRPIVTEILPSTKFYKAEERHQDYHKKRRLQYQMYKLGSGRGKIKKVWENRS